MLCILREVNYLVRSNYDGVGKFGIYSTHEEVKNFRKKYQSANLNGRHKLGDIDVDERIVFKYNLKRKVC
jgi:hypothetical protein